MDKTQEIKYLFLWHPFIMHAQFRLFFKAMCLFYGLLIPHVFGIQMTSANGIKSYSRPLSCAFTFVSFPTCILIRLHVIIPDSPIWSCFIVSRLKTQAFLVFRHERYFACYHNGIAYRPEPKVNTKILHWSSKLRAVRYNVSSQIWKIY